MKQRVSKLKVATPNIYSKYTAGKKKNLYMQKLSYVCIILELQMPTVP